MHGNASEEEEDEEEDEEEAPDFDDIDPEAGWVSNRPVPLILGCTLASSGVKGDNSV